MHRYLFGLLLMLCLSVPSVFAQDVFETFSAGGVENLMRSDPAVAEYAEATRDAIQYSLDALLPLWEPGATSVPFQTFVEVLAEADPEAEAEAALYDIGDIPGEFGGFTFSGTEACYVTVYAGSVVLEDAPTVLAHELSHCFQDQYIVGSFTGTSLENSGWWMEGTAEWLASLVYPGSAAEAFGLGVAQEELLYLAHDQQPITDTASNHDAYGGYGSLYLWQYLASPGGIDAGLGSPEAVLASVREVPTTITSAEAYEDYLTDVLADPAAVFNDFAVALARQDLAFQPMPSELFGATETATLPHNLDVDIDDYAVQFDAYRIESIEGSNAVRVSTRGLTDASIVVSVNTEGDDYTQVTDASPVTLCLPETGVVARIVTTRADGDAESPFIVRMEATTVSEDECDSPALGESAAPDCIVGTWQLTNDPMEYLVEATMSDVHAESIPGMTVVAFAEDGSVAYSMNDWTLAIGDNATMSGGIMTMDAAMTGRIAYSFSPDGTYTVSDFNLAVQDLSVMANINGFEMDMTDVVLGALDLSATYVPQPAQLRCSGNLLDWVIVYNGQEYVWMFSRVA